MEARIAKHNHILMNKAIQHYLKGNKEIFTFMSLWNDEEPYPLNELILCLEDRIKYTELHHQETPISHYDGLIMLLKKQHSLLTKIKIKHPKGNK